MNLFEGVFVLFNVRMMVTRTMIEMMIICLKHDVTKAA